MHASGRRGPYGARLLADVTWPRRALGRGGHAALCSGQGQMWLGSAQLWRWWPCGMRLSASDSSDRGTQRGADVLSLVASATRHLPQTSSHILVDSIWQIYSEDLGS
ncbi:hypothetical protein BDA96_05G219000 [Sorghum bicolor]|uniref:Uncharacterized protein n=2 Tax=Sorghum bicolor TaxID=4558 RepID=A0A921R0M5_SORBI|nr:hypothetical protein BDA96_05G219000 [Sorghum bicolor]OQU83942.1 hypothetical protein SORBI_3005G202901 [Sorghum bicolor]